MTPERIAEILEALDLDYRGSFHRFNLDNEAAEVIWYLQGELDKIKNAEVVGYLCKVGLQGFQAKLLDTNDPAKWTPLIRRPE